MSTCACTRKWFILSSPLSSWSLNQIKLQRETSNELPKICFFFNWMLAWKYGICAAVLLIIFVKGNTVNYNIIRRKTRHVISCRCFAIQTTSLNYIVRHVPNYHITMRNILLPLTVTLQNTSRCFIINQEHPTANYVSKYYVRSVSNGFLYALAACYVSGLIWRLLP